LTGEPLIVLHDKYSHDPLTASSLV